RRGRAAGTCLPRPLPKQVAGMCPCRISSHRWQQIRQPDALRRPQRIADVFNFAYRRLPAPDLVYDQIAVDDDGRRKTPAAGPDDTAEVQKVQPEIAGMVVMSLPLLDFISLAIQLGFNALA